MQLLHVDSSIQGANSVSRLLSAKIVEAERRRAPALKVIYRDLAAAPLQHVSAAHLAAAHGAATKVAAAERAEASPGAQAGRLSTSAEVLPDVSQGSAALEEFLASNIVVIGAPMYNFTIPSQLKAWIDRLAVAGRTFKYGPKGPEGLAGGKKVIIASSRGGFYGADSQLAFLDHQETYLRCVFQFFGITDISVIRAEGLGVSAQRGKSIAAAEALIAASA